MERVNQERVATAESRGKSIIPQTIRSPLLASRILLATLSLGGSGCAVNNSHDEIQAVAIDNKQAISLCASRKSPNSAGFIAKAGNFGSDLFMMDRGTWTNLTNSSDKDEFDPDLSPEGKTLAFSSMQHFRLPWYGNNQYLLVAEVKTMNLETNEARSIAGSGGWLFGSFSRVANPRWSADGAMLAFSAMARKSGRFNIYTISQDGTQLKSLTKPDKNQGDNKFTTGDYYPQWSKDGKYITFIRKPDGVWVNPNTDGNIRLEFRLEDFTKESILAVSIDGNTLADITNDCLKRSPA